MKGNHCLKWRRWSRTDLADSNWLLCNRHNAECCEHVILLNFHGRLARYICYFIHEKKTRAKFPGRQAHPEVKLSYLSKDILSLQFVFKKKIQANDSCRSSGQICFVYFGLCSLMEHQHACSNLFQPATKVKIKHPYLKLFE